jgi:hypothetical protein
MTREEYEECHGAEDREEERREKCLASGEWCECHTCHTMIKPDDAAVCELCGTGHCEGCLDACESCGEAICEACLEDHFPTCREESRANGAR